MSDSLRAKDREGKGKGKNIPIMLNIFVSGGQNSCDLTSSSSNTVLFLMTNSGCFKSIGRFNSFSCEPYLSE